MPKWMPYDGYVGPLGTKLRPIQCIEKNAEEIASRHNADIAALEAERDELRRRLDAVLDRLPEGGVWCYTCNRASVPVTEQEPYEHIPLKYNQMKTIFLCPICRRDGYAKDSCVSTLRAIAEGRTE